MTKVQVWLTQVMSWVQQNPGVLLVAGVFFLFGGVIMNTKSGRNANFNILIIIGVALFMIGMFGVTGISFMSF